MGRTSKFSFPYPGRKRSDSKTSEHKNNATSHATTQPRLNNNLSKAQKILGTGGDLNIDVPFRDDASSSSFRTSSRGMSIAVSDSTHDGEESYRSRPRDDWDAESGVLPHNLRGKASSTLLGRRFHDDETLDKSSSDRALREEMSMSTLKTHYDRQKSPLSISQQTSASSIRDQALRKGFPPVAMPRSPILHPDHLDARLMIAEQHRAMSVTSDQASKKKPTRLDLSRLFSRKDSESLHSATSERAPSIMSPASSRVRVAEVDGRRKLVKVDSRGKVPQANKSASVRELEAARTPSTSSESAYERHHNHQHQDPPSKHSSKHTPRAAYPPNGSSYRNPEALRSPLSTDEQYSWKTVHATIPPPPSAPWDNRSFTSNSSHNTKGSRLTSASVFSSSDLRNNSVLSLSSDEGSDDNVSSSSRNLQSYLESPARNEDQRRTKRSAPPTNINVSATRQSRIQDENFLTIPMPSPAGSRISGPWNSKRRESASSDTQEPQESRRGSVTSIASTATGRSSRVMTVTKQEEALLEALRQKRARMKDEVRKMVIAEQEETENSSMPLNTHARNLSKSTSGSQRNNRDSKSSVALLNASTYSPAPTSSQNASHGKHRIRDSSNSSQRTITRSDSVASAQQKFPTMRNSSLGYGNRDSQASTATVTTSGTINLYLDRALPLPLPLNNNKSRHVAPAEPSPDLSDFLSFGSDDGDDETPRTSWIVREQDRSMLRESLASGGGNVKALGYDMKSHDMPVSPKSRVRLSAVGLKRQDSNSARLGGNGGKGVTFVDEAGREPTPNGHDFLNDVDDDVVWGM